jgi:hypothetical protein
MTNLYRIASRRRRSCTVGILFLAAAATLLLLQHAL